jgi:hypothetical protein
MGDFLIKIHAVGGHGCNREAKQGEVFRGCGRLDCVDCAAADLVKQFAVKFPGVVQSAIEIHWPVELNKIGRSYDEAHEVVDDLYYVPENLRAHPQYVNPVERKRIKGDFHR